MNAQLKPREFRCPDRLKVIPEPKGRQGVLSLTLFNCETPNERKLVFYNPLALSEPCPHSTWLNAGSGLLCGALGRMNING